MRKGHITTFDAGIYIYIYSCYFHSDSASYSRFSSHAV